MRQSMLNLGYSLNPLKDKVDLQEIFVVDVNNRFEQINYLFN